MNKYIKKEDRVFNVDLDSNKKRILELIDEMKVTSKQIETNVKDIKEALKNIPEEEMFKASEYIKTKK